jgi:ribosomal protein L32
MPMTNYRDLSSTVNDVNAGFQFEFYCELTGETWRSPFKPYRKGQLSGWLSRATVLFSGAYSAGRAAGFAAEGGAKAAKAEALAEAQELAAPHFRQCERCKKWVCLAAWIEDRGMCTGCVPQTAGRGARGGSYSGDASDAAGGPVCPNCETPSQGGRFCHECGFDMASTHKSCPGCGTTLARQARFCPDCGHAF